MATEATTATGLPSTYEAIGMVTGDIIPSAMSNPVSIPVSHQTVLIPIMVVGLIAIPVCIPYGVCLYTAINPDPSSFATFVISTQPCFTISVHTFMTTPFSFLFCFYNNFSQKIIGIPIINFGKYCSLVHLRTINSRLLPGSFPVFVYVASIVVIVCIPAANNWATWGKVDY